jgi:hypothetical protein
MSVILWGNQEPVDSPVASGQTNESVAGLAGGGYVVVWNEGSTALNQKIHAQIFDAFGNPVGAEFQVGTGPNALLDPVVTGTANGGFAVAWQYDSSGNGTLFNIQAQAFSATRTLVGSQQTLGPLFSSTSQFSPSIAADGPTTPAGYTVTYIDNASHIGYNDFGGLAGEATLASQPVGSTAVAENLVVGAFMATTTGTGTSSAIYGSNLNAIGNFKINISTGNGVSNPAVATLGNGLNVVVWQEASSAANSAPAPDDNGYSIRGQLVQTATATGAESLYGGEFLINTLTNGDQTDPKVTALADGGFVVTWQTNASGTFNIDGQEFDAFANRVGSEFVINTNTTTNQVQPVISELPDGRLIAVWQDDSTGFDTLHQQILDPRGQTIVNTGGSPILVANNLGDMIEALGGNVSIYGGMGNDQIYGGNGDDTIYEPGGNNTIIGGSGFNTLVLNTTKASATITHNPNGSWTVSSPLGQDLLTNINDVQFTDQTVSLRVPENDDFTTSGLSGVLLDGSGNLIDWTLSNGAYAGYFGMGNTGTYGVVGTGDYSGYGNDDVLLENGSGGIIDWVMQNGVYASYNGVGNAGAYGVVGSGDFSGNGSADILLENGGGNLIDWMLKDGVFSSSNNIGNTSGYGVVGTGDFTGNGTADILLENGSGALIDWDLKNGIYAGYNTVGNASGYGVMGTGDFNGDGTMDILLENGAGNVIDWLLKNGVYAGWNEIGNASDYSIAATGDYNGDGTTDILLQNGSGNIIDWIMKNGTFSSFVNLGAASGYGVIKS